MPNKIKPKRSYTANAVPVVTGSTPDIEQHEIAINWADSKLYTRNASNQLVSITLGGGGGGGEDTLLRSLFVPAAPTSVLVAAGDTQGTVSWTAPTGVIAQAPITDYTVQYSSNSGSTWTTFTRTASTATSATVTGLTNGTSYVFRVAAVNAVGAGSYSTASSAVTVGVPTDQYFSNVSLLLHADGSDSTFVDSSPSPKTLTGAYGGSTQSATQSKWGGKSAHFAGNGYLVSSTSSADFGFGTGDFCIEAWVYITNNVSKNNVLVSVGTFGTGILWRLGSTAGVGNDWLYLAGNPYNYGSSGTALPTATWTHVALSRSSGVLNYYIGGTRVYTAASTDNLGSSQQLWIGTAQHDPTNGTEWLNAYVDDLRITKGSGRGYTGATITVPTAAFPDA